MINFVFWILVISNQTLNASSMKRDYLNPRPYCSMHHCTEYQERRNLRFERELVD